MERRGVQFDKLEPSTYGQRLHQIVRREEPQRFVDTMICCAFIEARSCERMQLLAENLQDDELRTLYAGLLKSEARHHQTYLDLAAILDDKEAIAERVHEISMHEAQVISVPDADIRLHS